MNTKDKVVVVTGGANGIGAGLCRRFVQEGAATVVVVDRDAPKAVALAQEIGAVGMGADVGVEQQLVDVIDRTEREHGPIDLFCSNAGVGFGQGPLAPAGSCSDQEWQQSWQVNVMAHVYAARALIPRMIERGGGYFLNTASAAGLLTHFASSSYSATKHAAVGFAETIAINHAEQGIGVSVLCPQGVRTKMYEDGETMLPGLLSAYPVLAPEQVADAVIEGLAKRRFLILPHPQVAEYLQQKTADYDGWIGAMQHIRRRLLKSMDN